MNENMLNSFKQMVKAHQDAWQNKNWQNMIGLYHEQCQGQIGESQNVFQGNQNLVNQYSQRLSDIQFDFNTTSTDVLQAGNTFMVVNVGKLRIGGQNNPFNYTQSWIVQLDGNNAKIMLEIFKPVY